MRDAFPFDEGRAHEAILRRSGKSGARGFGSHPAPGRHEAPPDRHYDRSARSSLDEDVRAPGETRIARTLPEARPQAEIAAVERRWTRRVRFASDARRAFERGEIFVWRLSALRSPSV